MVGTLLAGGDPPARRSQSERVRGGRLEMTRTMLKGLNGSNPLAFMASVGLIRLLDAATGNAARLGFTDDGAFHPWIECDRGVDVADVVARDAASGSGPQAWR